MTTDQAYKEAKKENEARTEATKNLLNAMRCTARAKIKQADAEKAMTDAREGTQEAQEAETEARDFLRQVLEREEAEADQAKRKAGTK